MTEEDFVADGKLLRHSIDHICLSSRLAAAVVGVEAWEGTVNGTDLSNHSGVMVDLGMA